MKTLRHIFTLITTILLVSVALSSCIEDSFTDSPSDQPTFSTDTVRLGNLFTLDASPTQRFIVYNRHNKGLNISRIAFADDPEGHFRLNVDGMSGREFNNVEIRQQDSIFIFVEATLPENGRNMAVDLISHIEFQTNGVSNKLPVKATGRDVTRLKGNTRYSTDTRLASDKPYQVFDSLVVEQGATLTIPAGRDPHHPRRDRNLFPRRRTHRGSRYAQCGRHFGTARVHDRRPFRLRCRRNPL